MTRATKSAPRRELPSAVAIAPLDAEQAQMRRAVFLDALFLAATHAIDGTASDTSRAVDEASAA